MLLQGFIGKNAKIRIFRSVWLHSLSVDWTGALTVHCIENGQQQMMIPSSFIVWLPHHCQQHGTWKPCQIGEGGRGWNDLLQRVRSSCIITVRWRCIVVIMFWQMMVVSLHGAMVERPPLLLWLCSQGQVFEPSTVCFFYNNNNDKLLIPTGLLVLKNSNWTPTGLLVLDSTIPIP